MATDIPTAATSLQQAMATLDSDIAAALARFAGAVNGTDSPLVEGEGEHLTDAAFASVCATCTDLTRRAGSLAATVHAVVAHFAAARDDAGIEPACPCYDCADKHAATPARRRLRHRLN